MLPQFRPRVLGSVLDMVVDDILAVENKSTRYLARHDPRQLLNYLRATTFEVGLLFHYGPEPTFYRIVSRNNKRRAQELR